MRLIQKDKRQTRQQYSLIFDGNKRARGGVTGEEGGGAGGQFISGAQ